MRLPKLALENSSFTWMVFIFLAAIGVRALLTMPRTENPELNVPGTSIVVVMPGSNPVEMENLIAIPIEESINELSDIKKISTSVRKGIASVSVEFDFNTDADAKYEQVQQKVNNIRNELPDEIMQMEIWQWTTTDISMLQLALVSDSADFNELKYQSEKLKDLLEKNKNIKSVDLFALPDREVHINLDFELMSRVNTSLDMVIKAIQSNNTNIPGGDIEVGDLNISVTSSGSYKTIEEIRNTVVNSHQGRLIYLENIADISFDHENLKYFARYGGNFAGGQRQKARPAVFIAIKQKESLNVLKTKQDLKPIIKNFEQGLPEGMSVETVFDQASKVRDRINGFLMNLLQGIILVAIVIFLSLGVRSSLVVATAIPLSLVIALGFIDIWDYGLQQISIAALVVSLGLLVDNSIVMVENISRFMAKGYNRKEASVKAASEIGWPVASATFTTILAFIPIATMPDKAGAFIESLPVTIMVTLTASLLIALTLTPSITGNLFREKDPVDNKVKGTRKALQWISTNPFRKSLLFALEKPWLIVFISTAILLVSVWMFRFVGISFFPKAEQSNLMIQATLPEGTNINKTDKTAKYITSVLDTTPEVKYYAVNVGHGNPQIYYNVFPQRFNMQLGDIYVELHEYDPDQFRLLLEKLRNTFSSYPGARIRVIEFEQGPPFDAPIQVFVNGNRMDDLKRISSDVESMIAEQDGVINIENLFVKTSTELFFDINRDKANMLGIPVAEIDRTIRTAVEGLGVSDFRDENGEESRMVLRMKETDDFKIPDLDKVFVSSLSGKLIPLKQVVNTRFRQAPSTISRYQAERTAEILADIETGYSLDDIMDEIKKELDNYPLPDGFSYHIAGELEGRNESFSGMANAIIIALLSIFAVLVLQFRSIRQPFIIFLAIPFAATGMIWALLVTGYTFSFTAFVGLTSLMGIVVNNSIILVDYTNRLHRNGKDINESLRIAAETRLTPIVLTAFTTIGGLLPLTLRGGTLWAPMGWTIIGGLLVSTLLTLIVVPVFYKLLMK
ncbi:MAG: efflux RND transporter permease subunit [Bacteroidales bacterium]|nr:efflux RND transporter permease subunit [Bacteroidales bacterium]